MLILFVGFTYGQNTLGFEFGCVSGKQSEISPTGKIGMVFTAEDVFDIKNLGSFIVVGINAPHERHPILDEVRTRIHFGAYTRLGIGWEVIKDRLTLYPHWVHNTRYYNIADSEVFYKPDFYGGIALKLSDPEYKTSFTFVLDKRNVLLGLSFDTNFKIKDVIQGK